MTAIPEEPESALPEEPESPVDEAGRESFPASDPPASWAGPDIVPLEGDESRAAEETDASRAAPESR